MEEILAKYFSREASTDEIKLVEEWRAQSEENAKAFFDYKKIWIDCHTEIVPDTFTLNKILGNQQVEEEKTIPLMLRSWIKYASAAVLVLALSLLFILNNAEGDTTYIVQDLNDGSEVFLHDNATIEVIRMDDRMREVRLTGTGYFDITRDESKPFIIHTENAEVKVLGTSFLVKASENYTEVCVESGLVEFLKADNNKIISVKLAEGEMGVISNLNKGIIKKNISDPNYLAWKTKIITFEENTMGEVAKILEDVYGIEVQFANPAFKNCKLTAKFNKKKAKDAIEIISRTFGISYDLSEKTVIFKGKGC